MDDVKSQTAPENLNTKFFNHRFDLRTENFIPYYCINNGGPMLKLKELFAEMNWLFNVKDNVNELTSEGHHWRNHLGLAEDHIGDVDIPLEERYELAAERLKEAGVEIETLEQLTDHFVNNGMMAKHLTLQKCLTEIGIPETRSQLIYPAGYCGINHGAMFSVNQPDGSVFFRDGRGCPAPETTFIDNATKGIMTYVPNPILLYGRTPEIPVLDRVNYLSKKSEYYPGLWDIFTDFNKGIVSDETKVVMEGLGLEPVVPEDDNYPMPVELAKALLDNAGVPSTYFDFNLCIENLEPISDYITEVLPHIVYAHVVAAENNAVIRYFNINAYNVQFHQVTTADLEVVFKPLIDMEKSTPIGLAYVPKMDTHWSDPKCWEFNIEGATYSLEQIQAMLEPKEEKSE